MRKHILPLMAGCLATFNTQAQTLEKAFALNGPNGIPGYSNYSLVSSYYQANGKLFFSSNFGYSLWAADAAQGTVTEIIDQPLHDITVLGNKIYFVVDDGTHGEEIWYSDGTQAGTAMLKDIHPNGGSYAQKFTIVGNKIFFWADDEVHGMELWSTDGTSAGTQLVKDFVAGSGSTNAQDGRALGNKYYFCAQLDYITGRELYVSDGTDAGTVLLADLNPQDYGSGDPKFLGVADNKLFLKADTSGAGFINSSLFYAASTGHTKVKDTFYGLWLSRPMHPGIAFQNKLLLAIDGGIDQGTGTMAGGGDGLTELWSTDGTKQGTTMLANVVPDMYIPFNNKLFFRGMTGGTKAEIWSSDGTVAGTQLLKQIGNSGSNSGSYPSILGVYKDKLYFTARASDTSYYQFWETDGTAANTRKVQLTGGVVPSYAKAYELSYYSRWEVINDTAYFAIEADSGAKAVYKFYVAEQEDTTTAVAHMSSAPEQVTVYPNPAGQDFQVAFRLAAATTVGFSLRDLTGRMVAQYPGEKKYRQGDHKVSLRFPSGCAGGIYFLHLKTGTGARTVQLIKR